MLRFRIHYFLATILLLLIEIFIGVFVHDNFIRPFVGDLLVVILVYCFVQSFFKVRVLTAAIFVLLFSYVVELLQYLHIVNLLGMQHSKMARIIIGTSFDWMDILAYTIGILVVLLLENKRLLS